MLSQVYSVGALVEPSGRLTGEEKTVQISRAGDYALRAVVYLSRQAPDRLCTIGEIASSQQIPQAFLAKLMPMLIKGEVVKSVQGPKGGYRLTRGANEINFLEVIQAIEGPIRLVHCQEDGSCCDFEEFCTMNEVFALAQKQLVEFFRNTTFADLAATGKESAADGRPVGELSSLPAREA